MTHHLWYMASKIRELLNTLLFYLCFDDVWTTIRWIVQNSDVCCVSEQELWNVSIKRESDVLSLIRLLRGNWTERSPLSWDVTTPSHPLPLRLLWQWLHPLCHGLAPTGCMKSGMCAETWQWLNILPILSWTGSGNVGKGKFGKRGEMFNFRKTSTLGLHGVWGGHKYHTYNWMTSR